MRSRLYRLRGGFASGLLPAALPALAQRAKPNTMQIAAADLGYGDIPAAMAAEKAAASDTEH